MRELGVQIGNSGSIVNPLRIHRTASHGCRGCRDWRDQRFAEPVCFRDKGGSVDIKTPFNFDLSFITRKSILDV